MFKIIELLEEYEHFRKRAKIPKKNMMAIYKLVKKKKSRLRRGKMFFL